MMENMKQKTHNAGIVKYATGLSYRQMNEWDKRGTLPHSREGESGWRKYSFLQIVSLNILSGLHSHFGIPLEKLRCLYLWMIGEQRSELDQIRIKIARGSDEPVGIDAKEVVRKFDDLALSKKHGLVCLPDILELARLIGKNPIMGNPFYNLTSGILPIWGAYCSVASGRNIFLVTNLDESFFFDAEQLRQFRQRLDPDAWIEINVGARINEMLKKMGKKEFRFNDDVIPADKRKLKTSGGVRQIVDTLDNMDSGSIKISVTTTGGEKRLRMEVERHVDTTPVKDISKLLEQRAYQTLTIKQRNGAIVNIRQIESVLLDDEKNSTPREN